MKKDIELLTELKGQFVEAMVVESKKTTIQRKCIR